VGLLDGSRRYNHAEPGATAFLFNALCVGLIPGIIMAQVPPNDRYFDIQDKSLYKKPI